jgi:hypothetical protein
MLQRVQRLINIKIMEAYRTISFEAEGEAVQNKAQYRTM